MGYFRHLSVCWISFPSMSYPPPARGQIRAMAIGKSDLHQDRPSLGTCCMLAHTANSTLSHQPQSFVVPFINYAVSHSMVATPSSVVKIILAQFSQNLLQDVPNHIFAAHLMSIDPQTKGDDPSRTVDEYVRAWWISGISVDLGAPLPWESIRKCVDYHVRQWVRV